MAKQSAVDLLKDKIKNLEEDLKKERAERIRAEIKYENLMEEIKELAG